MAGSHSKAGITGGRMYRLEGSWDPIDSLIGEPPGIPGRPCPAEPNLFPTSELLEEPTPGLDTDADPAVEAPALDVADGIVAGGVCPA